MPGDAAAQSPEPERGAVRRPLLFVNPRGDAPFVAAAYAAMHALRRLDPSALEQELRATWPSVVVRARALAGEQDEIWYVFRDGRWSPPEGA